ncbi:MAG: hypothetical protein LBI53_07810 [Candidatus Peribacteria bacterium]|nr:hypothetical protein [Candidatus Peribacteria bacterium]
MIIQLSGLFQNKEENKETNALPKLKMLGISVGRAIFLLWLTSGMGAFLVMVDNKTDLGVMAFSLLALLGGAIFLHQLIHQKK